MLNLYDILGWMADHIDTDELEIIRKAARDRLRFLAAKAAMGRIKQKERPPFYSGY